MNKIIGIDIGATKMIGGIFDGSKIVKKVKKLTEANLGIDKVLDNVVEIVKALAENNEELLIGIGIAGQIDSEKGKIIKSPNMPKLDGIDFSDLLLKKLNGFKVTKIAIENDANCFVLAEAKFGAGKGFKNILGLTIGTGIGSGIIVDSKLYKGQGFGAEAGHMMLGEKSFENLASGSAIEKCYGQNIDAVEIENKIERDDIAKKCYETAGKYLGIGIADLINILCPEIIIIGGGLARSDILIESAKKEMGKYIFYKDVEFKVEKAMLGDDAGMIGAGLLISR
ncbi:MAG: ROK family protein [Patescibacteria group bacterium]|jgi:glucokinase